MPSSTPWARGQSSPSSPKSGCRPEALHTRKPSLTNSVSSNESYSTRSTRSTGTVRRSRVLDFDPLSQHPTFQPPPRLFERPFIHNSQNSQSIEDEAIDSYLSSQEAAAAEQAKVAAVPSRPAAPVDSPRTPIQVQQQQEQQQNRSRELASEGDDYFLFKVQQHIAATRPQLPRSHWSESTINTMASAAEEEDDDEEDDEDSSEDGSIVGSERPVRESRWQNFSHKRLSPPNPKRPQMKSLDSVEDFIKRGGWKRKGIVFQQEGTRSSNTLF
ncbi:uncharacterized protein GLRG_07923 [Colletotrichum graminicola M1.001]|uniref:AGC-kinase C-terminal domain-containing protein n=1 Tax=Colletotrichum graminicola (strain M1.001 / M2 / FGSC 10212) TaxID=645133 RepID=E3QPJ1_COLGM|nr:uncharacterized protein GLRG_07923 [Colletotrichum graminicola M1.001]EFQ32779.1 hypothetical protein GLRG_07923 [Colletotrichum graminicola M1.001]